MAENIGLERGFLLVVGGNACGFYGALDEAKKAADPHLKGANDIMIEDSTSQPLCRHWYYAREIREWVLSE